MNRHTDGRTNSGSTHIIGQRTEPTYRWMDRHWINRQIGGQKDEWTERWMDRKMNGQTYEWKDLLTNRETDGWTHTWTERLIYE